MIRVIHSIPSSCPDCDSPDLGGIQLVIAGHSNTILCDRCGITMVLRTDGAEVDTETRVLAASILSCRHCGTVDEIQVAGGEEWCSACGLDPSVEDYSAMELAHLWREDSGIRKSMVRGTPKSTMGNIYRFLISSCGPHCAYAEVCPQSTANFAHCFREEVLESEDPQLLYAGEGNEVGKRGRRRSRKIQRQERKRIREEQKRATLACAGSGWYEKKYSDETENPQKSEHTGSGSGT